MQSRRCCHAGHQHQIQLCDFASSKIACWPLQVNLDASIAVRFEGDEGAKMPKMMRFGDGRHRALFIFRALRDQIAFAAAWLVPEVVPVPLLVLWSMPFVASSVVVASPTTSCPFGTVLPRGWPRL